MCQSVFGYPCAAWHSYSVVRLNVYGGRLRSFNIIPVLRFREVLRIVYGLNRLIGHGLVATSIIGLRKNQRDYVKLLFKHTTILLEFRVAK
jgi:hypothetical protein